ncbi:MAG: alcohol dehydrogenase catalytic domain-containing protein [Desulfobacterales bacterium]
MKAVKLTGPKQLELSEINAPQPDGENVIIQISACSICESDLHYWHDGCGMGGCLIWLWAMSLPVWCSESREPA